MSKSGRKRRQGAKRSPSGKINTWEDPRGTVDIQRQKQEIARRRDPKYGYPLGILHVERMITDEMFEAGCAYAWLAWRYSQIKGFMLPRPRAINWEGSQGRALASEPTPSEVEEVEKRMDEANAALQEHFIAITVLINDEWPMSVPALRRALQSLVDWRQPKRKAIMYFANPRRK